MTMLEIRDMAADRELDREAMAEIHGGHFDGFFGGIDILSPNLHNKVTPIEGAVRVPTTQTNNLAQLDKTVAANGDGINFVSNNKFAFQANSNNVSGFLDPFVD